MIGRIPVSFAIALGLGLIAAPVAAQSGLVRVFGVGVPSAPTSRWGTRNTVVFNVRVRNDSSVAVPCLIRVELEGVATSSASPIATVPVGAVTLMPVSVDVDLTGIHSGGSALRFSVVLLNAARAEMNRFSGTLAVQPVTAALVAAPPVPVRVDVAGASRDIAIERILYADPRNPNGAGFVAVVRNRGRERWAYVGEIGSQIGLGTPESHVEWSSRFVMPPARLPSGLAPGDSALVWLRLQPVTMGTTLGGVRVVPNLPADLWITLRVFVASSYDVNPANDALYYVLRLNADHRVVESRTLPAPPLTVQVRTP